MNQYLRDTQFAAKNLIELAHAERLEILAHAKWLSRLEKVFGIQYLDFATAESGEDFTDAYVNRAYARAMQTQQNKEAVAKELAELEQTLLDKEKSVQALCGALLQIAKQGIATVHGELAKCAPGRRVAGVDVKDIIWQGRNQAMHSEEGKFSDAVTNVFAVLETNLGAEFSLLSHVGKSRATQVVLALDWTDYAKYLEDMWTLLP